MTDKAYIVANKEQELDVLKELEQKGVKWISGREPTDFLPSYGRPFPIVLFERDCITWDFLDHLKNEEVVFDGRKEENMDKKYKVTQEFMNDLVEWRDDNNLDAKNGASDAFVDGHNIQNVPDIIDIWWIDPDNPIDNNNRLIAIIQWLNGEDVFEIEEPHKFVVRSDKTDKFEKYSYVLVRGEVTSTRAYIPNATKFDTREEAQEWANSHQVVVEIDEEGNEVE